MFEYFTSSLNSEGDTDYTTGIFQSIGFKEFHNYLLLSPEEKDTDRGNEDFKKGVELLKIATRQYARYFFIYLRVCVYNRNSTLELE